MNELFYMIADNLQLTLQAINGKLHGAGQKELLLGDTVIGYTVTVKESHTNKDSTDIVVLVHVLGYLYLVLHCSVITNEATVLLLDGHKLKLSIVNRVLPLHTNIDIIATQLSDGIVGVFRKSNDEKWIELC